MAAKVRDLRLEVASLALVFAAACLLSSGSWKRSRLVSWLLWSRKSIDNIYQLLPVLQKNARALFLVFNDLASSINSVAGAHNGETPLPKEAVRVLLNQEWVQKKLRGVQESVLAEFSLDASALDEAIDRFRNDDQVQMYINGVELMFNTVLEGGYPQCPGVEHHEEVTKQFVLSVVEKVVSAKRRLFLDSPADVAAQDRVEIDIVSREMQRFGCFTPLDAFIAFKNAENCYQYDFEFVQARQRIYVGGGAPESPAATAAADAAVTPDPEVPRVTAEELRLMLETMEADAPLFLAVFESDPPAPGFLSFVKRRAESETKAVFAWMCRGDSALASSCTAYPAAIRFRGGSLEEVFYEPAPSPVPT